jgi:hypothetical protein
LIAIEKARAASRLRALNGEERRSSRSPSARDGHRFESPQLHQVVGANGPGFATPTIRRQFSALARSRPSDCATADKARSRRDQRGRRLSHRALRCCGIAESGESRCRRRHAILGVLSSCRSTRLRFREALRRLPRHWGVRRLFEGECDGRNIALSLDTIGRSPLMV